MNEHFILCFHVLRCQKKNRQEIGTVNHFINGKIWYKLYSITTVKFVTFIQKNGKKTVLYVKNKQYSTQWA